MAWPILVWGGAGDLGRVARAVHWLKASILANFLSSHVSSLATNTTISPLIVPNHKSPSFPLRLLHHGHYYFALTPCHYKPFALTDDPPA